VRYELNILINPVQPVLYRPFHGSGGYSAPFQGGGLEAQVKSPVSPCEVCGGQSGSGTGVSARVSVVPY